LDSEGKELASLAWVTESAFSMPEVSGHPLIIVRQVGEDEFIYQFPRVQQAQWDGLDRAHGLAAAGDVTKAEALLRRLVADYPEFLGARHQLVLLLDRCGRLKEALSEGQLAMRIALDALPASFSLHQARVPWHHLENRAFLRIVSALGLMYLASGRLEDARDSFERVMVFDPEDHLGARACLVGVLLALGRNEEVLEVCDRHRLDVLPDTLFGRVLAYYRLGRHKEAAEALLIAAKALPLVARELILKRHRKPGLGPRVVVGSADEAREYWANAGAFWQGTPGAVEFVRRILAGEGC